MTSEPAQPDALPPSAPQPGAAPSIAAPPGAVPYAPPPGAYLPTPYPGGAGSIYPAYAGSPYPPPGPGGAPPGMVPVLVGRPPGDAPAVHVEPLAGTPFGLAVVQVRPVTSGPAIGAMVAGIGSILVAFVALCLGLVGGQPGWGALVAGAFTILSVLLGSAALGTGLISVRAIRGAHGSLAGRGTARAGVVCGAVGIGLALIGFAGALIATAAS